MIQAVLFDLGHTLLYFDASWSDVMAQADWALLQALQSQGLHLDETLFLSAIRDQLEAYHREREIDFVEYTTVHVLRGCLAQFGYADLPLEQLRAALKSMYAVSQLHWKIEPDAIPTLESLRSTGYRLALVSNAADDEDVQTLVDRAGLRSYFEAVISSAAQGIRKPNPQIFLKLLHAWKISPAHAMMVGDTLGADVLGARNAGMHSVWITSRASSADNQAHAGKIQPDFVIHSLRELPELLSTLQ